MNVFQGCASSCEQQCSYGYMRRGHGAGGCIAASLMHPGFSLVLLLLLLLLLLFLLSRRRPHPLSSSSSSFLLHLQLPPLLPPAACSSSSPPPPPIQAFRAPVRGLEAPPIQALPKNALRPLSRGPEALCFAASPRGPQVSLRGSQAPVRVSWGSPKGSGGSPRGSGGSPRGCGASPRGLRPPRRGDTWKQGMGKAIAKAMCHPG